jgi:hypothetical protein
MGVQTLIENAQICMGRKKARRGRHWRQGQEIC